MYLSIKTQQTLQWSNVKQNSGRYKVLTLGDLELMN